MRREEAGNHPVAVFLAGVHDIAGRPAALPAGTIDMTRLRDANTHDPCTGPVSSLEFHPAGQIMLVAGADRKLRFFNVDGVRNQRVQSVEVADLTAARAAFAGGGAQAS